VVVGEKSGPDTAALLREIHGRFLPFQVTVLADADARRSLGAHVPALDSMAAAKGRAAAYVCRDYTCQLPVTDPARLGELLQ
jgi:uncharacterized protein YyaL (SSP411 family)